MEGGEGGAEAGAAVSVAMCGGRGGAVEDARFGWRLEQRLLFFLLGGKRVAAKGRGRRTRRRQLRGAASAPQLARDLLRLGALALGGEEHGALGAAEHACLLLSWV